MSMEIPEREALYSQARSVYSSIYTRTTRMFQVRVRVRASLRAKLRVCEYSYECGQVRVFVLVLASWSCCSSAVAS